MEPIPYTNFFPNQASTNCWNDSLGSLTPDYNSYYLLLDRYITGGTTILVTPRIHISSKAILNYSWSHRYETVNGRGMQDSLRVLIKGQSSSGWSLLQKYSAPFKSTDVNLNYIFEEIPLDTAYINDTVQVRFEYYSTNNSHALWFTGFRVAPEISDSIFSLPFLETFDGNTWRPDSGSNVFPVQYYFKSDPFWRMHPWNSPNNAGFKWVATNDTTPSLNTGPSGDHSGSGNYLYTEGSLSYGRDARLYSPYLNLTGEPYPEISFWYHMYGADMTTLFLDQQVNGVWKKMDSIVGPQQGSKTSAWKRYSLLLDSTGISRVRFRMKNHANGVNLIYHDGAIDDVQVIGATCPFANGFDVNFSNITTSSALAQWNAGPLANSYIIEYGPSGFGLGIGQKDTVSSNSALLQSLLANQSYDLYIRMLCGVSDSSDFRGPYSFYTDCNPTMAPYLETFNDSIIPNCWSAPNRTTPTQPTAQWVTTHTSGFPFYGATGKIDHTGNGGFAAGVDRSSPYPLDSISLYSPFIDVSNLRVPELRLWIFSNNTNYPGNNNPFYVDFYDGATWHSSVLTYSGDSTDWVELSVQLGQYNITGPVQFRLMVDKDPLNAAYYNDIVLDDISVTEGYGNSCVPPSNLSIMNTHCDSVTLSWNSDPSNIQTRIQYGPSGFDPNTSGTWINNASSPLVIRNLSPGLTYDFYVVDSCSQGLGIRDSSFTTDSTKFATIAYTSNPTGFSPNSVTYFFDARNTVGGNQFTWDFGNGNLIQGDTASWTYSMNAVHQVILTVGNSCGSIADTLFVNIQNIGLGEETDSDDIIIFPNPNEGEFEIQWPNVIDQDVEITLIDPLGRKVYRSRIEKENQLSNLSLDIKGLSAGTYLLLIQDQQGSKLLKRVMVL